MLRKYENLKCLSAFAILAAIFMSLTSPVQRSVSANTPVEKTSSEDSNHLRQTGYDKTPLLFEENKGQTDKAAKFISRASGYTLYLAESEAVFSLKIPGAENDGQQGNSKVAKRVKAKTDTLRMQFSGANEQTTVEGIDQAVTKTNYFIGKKEFQSLSNYKRVNYDGLYEGIDAVFYGTENNQLEYDFVVAPNADANQIRLIFDGAENIKVDEKGSLVIKTANTELVQQKPFAYQELEGVRFEVSSRYVISKNTVTFELGEYDRSRTLVIDPTLTYLTYIGGSLGDYADSIKVDSAGNAIVVGSTLSTDFPGPNTGSENQNFAVFVTKLSPDGRNIIYTTFLDGRDLDGISGFEIGYTGVDVAIDTSGNAYITGLTESGDFPTTANAYQKIRLCSRQMGACILSEEAFVTKLNSQGGIVYSTFLGGRNSDFANGIVVDSAGKAYITGGTNSGITFPTINQYQGTGITYGSFDAFLTVLNADGSDVVYSTGLGGYSKDSSNAIGIDASNNVYITGLTESDGAFPTKSAAQSSSGGGDDAFVAKFNPALSGEASLIYSTFLGGSGTDRGFGIAVSAGGQASVTGVTGSLNFPLKNPIDSTNQINEAFVTQYGTGGNLLNSTFLGGAAQDQGSAIAVGNGGTVYVTGFTLSNDFPTALPFQATRRGLRDVFVAKLRFGVNNSPGVASASFLGGTGNDFGNGIALKGNFIFVVGETNSDDLPTTNGVIKQASNASNNSDGFVAKILDTRKDTIGTFDPINTVFNLKNTLAGGAPDIVVDRGVSGDSGVAGDFNGDGVDTVSTFNNGTWKIFNFNTIVSGYPLPPQTVSFGLPGDLPIVGDWDGDGNDSVGTFRPSTGQFFLTNSQNAAAVDVTINFGTNGDLPVAGDWDGDGIDSVGVFRPSEATFFLTDDNVLKASIDHVAFFGIAEDLPIAGDWDGNGVDTIGVWRPSSRQFFLSNDNINVAATFTFGQAFEFPIAGDWNGKPDE